MGHGRGHRGICGERSRLVLLVPAIAGVIQRLRPDAHVHVLLESTGKMVPRHRAAICEALRIPDPNAWKVDAKNWCAYRRERTLFGTMPPPTNQSWTPNRRPPPWTPGWAQFPNPGIGSPPRTMPTMMRTRPSPSGLIQASTYQYHLCSLLYHIQDPDVDGLLNPYRSPNLHNLAAFFQRRINLSPPRQ